MSVITVKDIINNKLKPLTVDDVELELYIAEVEFKILNYTNRTKVPKALYFTWANMVVDVVRHQRAMEEQYSVDGDLGGEEGEDIFDRIDYHDISILQIGDAKVELKGGNARNADFLTRQSHQADLDAIVYNYAADLNNFRLLKWGG